MRYSNGLLLDLKQLMRVVSEKVCLKTIYSMERFTKCLLTKLS